MTLSFIVNETLKGGMDVRGRGGGGGGGGRLYTYRFTVTTGITSALLHDHTVRSVSGVCGEKLT